MKKLSAGKITSIVIFSTLAILLIWFISGYNSLVKSKESVKNQQSNIQTQLQRRLDLVPNLVETVKGYAAHESEVIKSVSDARAKLAGATSLGEKAQANTELTQTLSRLLVIAENYPDLKANVNFIGLQDELAGTENRIAVARNDYNKSATDYNKNIKTFPKVILADMFHFEEVEYFSADEGAKNAPKVEF